jgi:hypothetical protein
MVFISSIFLFDYNIKVKVAEICKRKRSFRPTARVYLMCARSTLVRNASIIPLASHFKVVFKPHVIFETKILNKVT